MSFFTEIQIPEFPWKLDYSRSTMLLGSCFSENIGQKMIDLKFRVDMNPFGILYNPESMANSLQILLENRIFNDSDLFQDQGVWNSFYHHSRFSDVNQEVVLGNINNRIAASHKFLKTADFLIVTFGTAWIYEMKRTGQIVSNCHKVPASEFKRFRLGVFEIVEKWRELMEKLWQFNPNLKLIFTVSPIRHWKDGASENQLSKATLLLAIDQLIRGFGDRNCCYFPSYEIMMDELRDYRFYAEDMLHLSPVAVDHIFDRFCAVAVSPESMKISGQVSKILKATQHRPFNPKSAEYEKFLRINLDEIAKLQVLFPELDWEKETAHFNQQLSQIR